MVRFKDRVAIVTGSSAGIGQAIALAFGREGGSVVLAARSEDKLRTHAEAIKACGGRALPVKTDISRLERRAGHGPEGACRSSGG